MLVFFSAVGVLRGPVAIRTNGITMQINIGELIRAELRRQGRTNEWLADSICVHQRTVQKIFLKQSIDTQQLFLISKALGVDFFALYSELLAPTDAGKTVK